MRVFLLLSRLRGARWPVHLRLTLVHFTGGSWREEEIVATAAQARDPRAMLDCAWQARRESTLKHAGSTIAGRANSAPPSGSGRLFCDLDNLRSTQKRSGVQQHRRPELRTN
jgi:hypothetical protein